MYDGKNQSTEVLKRWRIPGQITNVPKANFNIKNSTYFVEDGSYLRVKDISLSYNIRCRQFKKWGISRVQPYFTASNLLTWTSYSGMDESEPIWQQRFCTGHRLWNLPAEQIIRFRYQC